MAKLARAFTALAVAAALMVGIPVALIAIAGWPLPTKTPAWSDVYWDVRQGNLPAEVVIKVLACVVWLAWAQLAWALLWELFVNLPRLGQGRTELAAPLAPPPVSRLARRIVSAVMMFTTVASAPAMTAAAPPLSALAAAAAPPFGAAGVPTGLVHDASDTTRPVAAAATWTVTDGDTLWDIAELCLGDGSRVDDIVRCNPYLTPSHPLRLGLVIELPTAVVAPRARAPIAAGGGGGADIAYTVEAGDTLWGIVEQHYGFADQATVLAVADHNAMAYPSLIFPGDQVRLPALGTPAAPTSGRTAYTVQRGDTLWGIVEQHYGEATSERVWALAGANELENPSLIVTGQQIALPDASDLETPRAPRTPASDEATTDPAPPDVATPELASAPSTDGDIAETPSVEPTPTLATVPVPAATTEPPTTTAPRVTHTPIPVSTPLGHNDPGQDTAPPTTVAPAAAASEVEARDVLSARWMFGSVAVTSLALGGAWVTLHKLRRRRRRWLGVTSPDSPVAPEPTEREQRARHDLAALAELVDADLATGSTVRAVLLGDDTELRVRDDTPSPPPGWDAGGGVWRRTDPTVAVPRVLSPALVTIGHNTDSGDIVLDLATAGTVSVTGDGVAVERLMCSMLWELAACPLGVPVELYVVGLACAAEQHTANRAQLVSLDDAVTAAAPAHVAGEPVRVFLVDPFAAGASTAALRDLVTACAGGSGRAVVIAGPCAQPNEEVRVPSERRCVWDDLVLEPPRLDEQVDAELSQMFAAVSVGRRATGTATTLTVVPDAQAEAVALRLTATMLDDSPDPGHDSDQDDGSDGDAPTEPAARPARAPEAAEAAPDVILTVCGRSVGVLGQPVPQLTAVLFALAAAERSMHAAELCDLTGYAPKSLSSVFTTTHPLIERESGALRLRDHVWTDHRWAHESVRRLAAAMQEAPDSSDTMRWTRAAAEALRAIEQGPYAVLPTVRERARATASAWGWVDEFPGDVPARAEAETEVAEAALAFCELWLAAPGTHTLVRPDEMVSELCRLAGLVPYANVARQVRPTPWVSGAECLLAAAAEVAGDDDRALARVQQTARAMAAREQLVASSELAEALGL